MSKAGVINRAGRPTREGQVTGVHRQRSPNKDAYEAFVDYLLENIGVRGKARHAYVAQLADRGTDVPQVRHIDAPKPMFGPEEKHKTAEEWLVYNIRGKGWDRVGPPFEIKQSALTHGGRMHRTIIPLDQLVMCVNFMASSTVKADFSTKMGLQLRVTTKHIKGDLLAQAVVDPKVVDPTCGTRGSRGAWFGPATLINSACAKCANAVFKEGKKVVEVRAAKTIAAGAEVLVPYAQGAGLTCAVCDLPVTRAAREDVEESDDEVDEVLPVSRRHAQRAGCRSGERAAADLAFSRASRGVPAG
jgi:hypothetical protein